MRLQLFTEKKKTRKKERNKNPAELKGPHSTHFSFVDSATHCVYYFTGKKCNFDINNHINTTVF